MIVSEEPARTSSHAANVRLEPRFVVSAETPFVENLGQVDRSDLRFTPARPGMDVGFARGRVLLHTRWSADRDSTDLALSGAAQSTPAEVFLAAFDVAGISTPPETTLFSTCTVAKSGAS